MRWKEASELLGTVALCSDGKVGEPKSCSSTCGALAIDNWKGGYQNTLCPGFIPPPLPLLRATSLPHGKYKVSDDAKEEVKPQWPRDLHPHIPQSSAISPSLKDGPQKI